MTRHVFVALSATGPVPGVHEPWELGLLEERLTTPQAPVELVEHLMFVRPPLSSADPAALQDSQFHERTVGFENRSKANRVEPFAEAAPATPSFWWSPGEVARRVARATAGAHLVASGAYVVAAMLDRFLRTNGQAPAWDQIVDVDSLAAGYLHCAWRATSVETPAGIGGALQQPWDTEQLATACNIDVTGLDRVEALPRARGIRRMFRAIAVHGRRQS